MSLPVAILAGGLATRLGDVARTVPKILVEVAGEPFAVHQLRLLREAGLTDLVYLVGHLGDEVQGVLGDGRHFGVSVRFALDGPVRLGTGGALKRALPLLGTAFLVLYGDSYLECDYANVTRAFLSSGKRGLMTVHRNDGLWDASNVEFAGGVIAAYSKTQRTLAMRHIDYGLGAFKVEAFDRYPADVPFDLASVYADLVAAGELAGYEVPTRFYEIGSPAGLEETRRLLEARTDAGRQ